MQTAQNVFNCFFAFLAQFNILSHGDLSLFLCLELLFHCTSQVPQTAQPSKVLCFYCYIVKIVTRCNQQPVWAGVVDNIVKIEGDNMFTHFSLDFVLSDKGRPIIVESQLTICMNIY